MCDSGIFPDCISGALLSSGDEPFDFNGSDTLVYEACEYKDSFLNFYPSYSVMLNIELDHTDYFKSIEQLKDSFLRAIDNSEVAIINTDCKNLAELKNKTTARTVLAGRAHDSHYQLTDVSENGGKYSFSVREAMGRVTKIRLNVIGEFQVHNALMAFAFAREYGIPSEKIKASLEDYIGIPRRLELIGKYKNHKLYYDYAHHPSEIRAGITAITKAESAPIVIFRPHTYSRTSSLFYDFASSLSLAKQTLILDIDGVREENESGVSSEALAREIGNNAARVTENEIPALLDLSDSPIVIMGAANLDKVKNRLGKEK
jgi:UDP-N-acetylmuramate--alanine ligase